MSISYASIHRSRASAVRSEIAWGYACAAYTERYDREPASQWINPSLLKTSNPVVQFVDFFGTTYGQWTWCQTYVTVRIEFHRCGFGSYFTYYDDFSCESSPSRVPILRTIFCHNHKFACAENFVGSGDCDDENDCLALLASQGKKFKATVEYHTIHSYYPGFPV